MDRETAIRFDPRLVTQPFLLLKVGLLILRSLDRYDVAVESGEVFGPRQRADLPDPETAAQVKSG